MTIPHRHNTGNFEIKIRVNPLVGLNYSYTDSNPINGISYYRLTQIDYNGDFEVLSPISVSFLNESNLDAYPNPANNEFNVNIASKMGIITINLYSTIGTLVKILKQLATILLSN